MYILKLFNCTLENDGGTTYDNAITLLNVSNGFITQNNLTSSDYRIFFEDSCNNTLDNNTARVEFYDPNHNNTILNYDVKGPSYFLERSYLLQISNNTKERSDSNNTMFFEKKELKFHLQGNY